MEMKVYRCEVCGNIVYKLKDSGGSLVCCNKMMREMFPGMTDGAVEKHVPVVIKEGNRVTVKVGEIAHPMDVGHHIAFIAVTTNKGTYIRFLERADMLEPEAVAYFTLEEDEKLEAAYEYCNLHGMFTFSYK